MNDIDLSPEEFRRLGYHAVDLITQRLQNIRENPVRQPVPPELREAWMHQDFPENGVYDLEALLNTVAEKIMDYPMGNSSPRFFGWVNSPPAPLGILAELFAAAHGASVAGGDQSATYVEHGVLNWFKRILGFPQEAGGILTSGGSAANLIGLAVMRYVKSEGAIRQQGFNAESAPMVIYAADQGHSSIQKAVELLGFGNDYFRKIPTNHDYQMDIDMLRQQIAADKAAGLRPVCIAGSAGTVNTGTIDPLEKIADICDSENLWMHIDGAYGAVGILAEPHLYAGLERVDSLAVDPHKWLYMPIECGCALVRDSKAMRDTFSLVPEYLRDDTMLPWFAEFGIQQTRGFRALKLWMVLHQIGENGYRELIRRDIALAKQLRAKIEARDDFELIAAGALSIVCFRYAPPGVDDLDALNKSLLEDVQASGRAFLTSTVLDGRYVLRACLVNFRTIESDLDSLLDVITDAGKTRRS